MNLVDWAVLVLKNLASAIYALLADVVVGTFNLLLAVVLVPLSLLPAPGFMQSGGLQALFNGISPDIWYFAHSLRLGECLAMFGAAVVFRLGRKIATLFQW